MRTIFTLIILFFFYSELNAKVEIKYKIGEEIITNIDILNEKKYLVFLRPNLKTLSNSEISEIAVNSLIREIIKKKELDKIFKDVDSQKIVNEIKRNLLIYKNVKSENELIELVNKNNIDYDQVIEKMKYEGMWNEFIFQKYSPLIKINRKKLKNELNVKIANNKKYEYNLSEILFDLEQNEKLNDKVEKIHKYIKQNDFKTAAYKFSISNSSNRGGEIGWIKETLLSKNLNSIISKLNKNNISNPIKYPNGYLLIKINDKKEMKDIINFEKELNEIINYEKNKQLNQFSLLFYKKLKQNSIINEF